VTETSAAVAPADLFTSLWDACVACGGPVDSDTCPDMVNMRDLLGLADRTGIVGHRVVVHPGPLRRASPVTGLVLAAGAKKTAVLVQHGRVETVPLKRVQVAEPPPAQDLVSCAGGELLAAALGGVSDSTRQLLRDRAVAFGMTGPKERHCVARDAAMLRALDWISDLRLSDGELLWWRALAAWGMGQTAEALTTLLDLPRGRYPVQLAVWWSAARAGQVSDELRRRAAPVLEALCGVSDECDVATYAVTRVLVPPEGPRDLRALLDEPLVDGAQRIFDRRSVDWRRRRAAQDAWQGVRSQVQRGVVDSPSHRVREAWQVLSGSGNGSTGSPEARAAEARRRLGPDPSILDEMPSGVLDDFIDAEVVLDEWLALAHGLACGDYLVARTDIAQLDDAALDRVGGHDERARRVAATGRRVPDEILVPAEERRRLNLAAAVVAGEDDLIVQAAAERGSDGSGGLARALREPSVVPDASLLADPVVAAVLLRRSAIDSAAAHQLRPEGLDDGQRLFASQALLRASKKALHKWDWPAALELARHCLRIARVERQRDEALNLLAAAHWELGNPGEAIKALQIALEGEYTAALQANIGVVAAELEPKTAASHLARLVREAPDLPLRVSAAKQVMLIWGHNRQIWLDTDPFPPEIAAALQSLVVQPIDEADFREIVRLLAEHDADWLAQTDALVASPHRGSAASRVWSARARGPAEFVRELASCLRIAPEPWMESLRDELVTAALQALTRQSDATAASFALLLLSEDLPIDVRELAVLRGLTASIAAAGINPTEAEPTIKLLDWLDASRRDVDRLPPKEQARYLAALQLGYDTLTAVYAQARSRQLDEVGGVVALVEARLRGIPPSQVNYHAVRQITRPAEQLCNDTITLMNRLRPHVNADLTPVIDEVSRAAERHRSALRRLAR
jgi:hypothetical protein